MFRNVCGGGRKFLLPTVKRSLHLPSSKFVHTLDCCNLNRRLPSVGSNSLNLLHAVRRQYSDKKYRLPSLLYIQHPWKYLTTKFNFLRLKLFWDRNFIERDFILGTKQAVVVLTELIRNQAGHEIGGLTTPMGFQQITRDMALSKDDPRLKLVQFRHQDIKKSIPVRVLFMNRNGRKHCVIDMFFVGMRNVDDFDSAKDNVQVKEFLRAFERSHDIQQDRRLAEDLVDPRASEDVSKVIFAEIFTRFYREYSPDVPADWFVSFYKIVSFDVLAFE